jgi:hypothetical protein
VEVTSIHRNGEEVLAEIMRPWCRVHLGRRIYKASSAEPTERVKAKWHEGKERRRRQSLMKPKELNYIYFGLAERALHEIVQDA